MDLTAYLDVLQSTDSEPEQVHVGDERPPHKGLTKLVLKAPAGLRPSMRKAQTALTWASMPVSSRRARSRLGSHPGPRLHLGCGRIALDGWVNVDLFGSRADLVWDLRRPIPFPDGSASAVFHEHLLEHLPVPVAVGFLRECRRVLAPGGILRVVVPDFEKYMRSYVDGSAFIDSIRPDRPTSLLAIEEIVYGYGHKSMWDGATLLMVLGEVGFEGARVRAYGDSDIQPAPDSSHRQIESLYVEARRP